MNIVIGNDHAGYKAKLEVIKHLENKGYKVINVGTDSEDSCDYPDFSQAVGAKINDGSAEYGIVICGSGEGISIAANKVKGVRCANVTSKEMAALAKEHNHANILALGGRILTNEQAFEFVDTWLSTEEGHDRHDVRVAMLNEM